MSSRAEEKEARRREREAQEQATARSAANRRRLQIVAGAVLGLALIGAIIAVVAGGGSDKKDPTTDAKAPTANIADFDEAVKASGCVYKAVAPTGAAQHTTKPVKYEENPPSSGMHNPEWADAGVYEPGSEPPVEKWVHSLEHGRIVITYRPGTPAKTIKELEGVFNEPLLGTPGYQKQVLQNNTKMPYAVAALAWGQTLTCKDVKNAPATYDAIRAFAARFANKAPEEVP
jgi:hypothetical protein